MPTTKTAPRLCEFRACLENLSFQLLISASGKSHPPKSQLNTALHNHVSAELFVCAEGEIIIRTSDKEIALNNGDIALIPPGIPHKNYLIKEGSRGYVLNFLCSKLKIDNCIDLYKMLSPFIAEKNILLYRNQPQLVAETVDLIAQSDDTLPLFTATNIVQLLIRLVHRNSESYSADKTVTRQPSRFRDINFMMKLDHLIANNYNKKISIRELAEQLYISPRQLDRIIQKRYEKTLHGVFMEKRIQSAEYYLSSTNMSIDKIAITVGFNSSSGLYREFAKKYGITPTEFRKRFINAKR